MKVIPPLLGFGPLCANCQMPAEFLPGLVAVQWHLRLSGLPDSDMYGWKYLCGFLAKRLCLSAEDCTILGLFLPAMLVRTCPL